MNEQQSLLIQELNKVAQEKVPEQDFQQQVDRWNRYQELLDKVERQCQIQGFQFTKNLRSSYRDQRKRMLMASLAIGMLFSAAFSFNEYFTATESTISLGNILDNLLLLAGTLAVAPMVQMFNFAKLPETIKFSCTPMMFIDDAFYVQRFIRGFARERNDPEVKLPALSMELPHSWIKQQSLIKAMDTMKDL